MARQVTKLIAEPFAEGVHGAASRAALDAYLSILRADTTDAAEELYNKYIGLAARVKSIIGETKEEVVQAA